MPRYVALLRAINVGGHTVTMPRLRAEFEALGLSDVATFIASGNVLCTARAGAAALERRIARALAAALGYEVATFLRTGDEMAAAVAHAPDAVAAEGGTLSVGFVPRTLTVAEQRAVRALGTEFDAFTFAAREVYWRSSMGVGKSKFTLARLERAVGLQATFRNVTTVRALAALMADAPPPARRPR